MKQSHFREWVRNIWLDNCSERDIFNEPKFDMSEYFQKYKYWLKREYKYQHKGN